MITQETTENNNYPIYNLEAETNILGGIMLDQNALSRIVDILTPEAFYIQAHQRIYRAAIALHKNNKPTDLIHIANYLEDRELLSSVGGRYQLADIVGTTVSTVNIDALAELVVEHHLRRKTVSMGIEITKLGAETYTDISVVLEEIKTRLENLYAQKPGKILSPKQALIERIKKIRQLESPVEQWFQWQQMIAETRKTKKTLIELALALESDEGLEILTSKEFAQKTLVETEWLFEGLLRKGTLALLVAESKTGKSLLHYDWTYCAAKQQQWGAFPVTKAAKVLTIQVDEPEVDCQVRIQRRGLAELDNVDVLTKFRPNQMARLRKKLAEKKYDLVVFDSLTAINRFSSYSTNDAEYAFFCYELKDLASEFGCTFLLVHHTNKSPVENGLDKIAGTYAIPASASDIFLLYRPQKGIGNPQSRILSRLGSRSDVSGKNWRLELNLENNSYIWEGACDRDGNLDDATEEEEKSTSTAREAILNHLRENSPTAYESQELSHFLGLNIHRVRSLCGNLASDKVISCKPSSRNSRANSFYVPSDRVDNPITYPDHFSNADTESDSASTDRAIAKNEPEKKHKDTFLQNFSPENSDRPITKPWNPDSASNTSTDRGTDRVSENLLPDQLEDDIAEYCDQIRYAIAENDRDVAIAIKDILAEAAEATKPKIWEGLSEKERSQFKFLLDAETEKPESVEFASPDVPVLPASDVTGTFFMDEFFIHEKPMQADEGDENDNFKIGDLVVNKVAEIAAEARFRIGDRAKFYQDVVDILEVDEKKEICKVRYSNGSTSTIRRGLLRKIPPGDSSNNKFKIGDRIVKIGDRLRSKTIGYTETVVAFQDEYLELRLESRDKGSTNRDSLHNYDELENYEFVDEFFDRLQIGDRLQLLHHEDHKSSIRSPKKKVGIVERKFIKDDRYYALLFTDGGLVSANLEAVKEIE